jgi:protein TonB
MLPAAVGLATLVHALVVLAIWWLSQDRFHFTPGEDVVEVTLEPLPSRQKEAMQAPPLPIDGLRPPADIAADMPTQVPPAEQSEAPPAPAPPMEQPIPAPPSLLQPAPPVEQAAPAPQPQAPPPSPADRGKSGTIPVPQQQHGPPQRLHEQQALAAPHPPPQAPRPEWRPSPLTTTPQPRPPAAAPGAEPPSQHPFVNPADTYNRARVSDNYLWQVARKLSGYRYQANTNANEGLTVVKVVIARNGRLLDVSVVRSSGIPEFDQGVLVGVRQGSPYSPLPPDIKGESASFTLPLVSSRR